MNQKVTLLQTNVVNSVTRLGPVLKISASFVEHYF